MRWSERSRAGRALLVLAVVTAVVLIGAGGSFAYASWKLSNIKRVAVAGMQPVSGRPFNVLLVGSDSRAFVKTQEQKKAFGTTADVAGQRSDVMMVVHIDPAARTAVVLSIPRDLYVNLDGGGKGRINEAYADRGDQRKADPSRLVRTIQRNLGITVNHYMEVDFAAFQQAVDAVGGIDVYFPYPAHDAFTGLNVKAAGCEHLDGSGALAYVRSRHYAYQKDGRTYDEPTGDLGRIARQHQFLRLLLHQIKRQAVNPLALNRVIDAGVTNLTVDEGFSKSDLVRTGRTLSSGDPSQVRYLSVPTEPFTAGGADVLRLVQPQTDEVLAQLGSAPLSKPAGRARVTSSTSTPTAQTGAAAPATAPAPQGSDFSKDC